MNGEDDTPEGTNLVELIDRLAEPPEPAAIPLTPQTTAWTVLAILAALLVLWFAWRAVRRWQANAYRRAALAELRAAGEDPVAIAAILRRAALAAWPREQVASLSGGDWLRFLDATGGNGFSDCAGHALTEAPYRSDAAPAPGLRDLATRWIRRHRVGQEARP